MGMNMATIASEAVCRLLEKETGAVMVSVSGNMCSDKKPAAINMISGRGKTVIAEATISRDIVESKLHTTPEAIVDTNYRKNLVGSSMSGTLGANAHAANMVAAFISVFRLRLVNAHISSGVPLRLPSADFTYLGRLGS